MQKTITAIILIALLLAGCVQSPKSPTTAPSTADTSGSTETSAVTDVSETALVTDAEESTSSTEETTETTSAPTETTEAPVETTAATEPAHSDLFISYVTPEDMVRYFNEVCLDAEFVNSGNATLLQRWESTICYGIYGDPTDEDLRVLDSIVQYLNTIEGFPGIRQAEADWEENLSIYFCDQQELIDRMGDQYWGVDGGFTFWYDGWNTIYDATICIRTDLDQEVRNSVILEEIYNSLGPAQDTDLRQESIIYSGYSIPQALHPIDKAILELLYHPAFSCGMTAAECEPIILSLYY